MAYTAIDDPSAYFQTTLYTGDGGGTRAVTHGGNSDLNADFVWIKDRGTTSTHYLFDSVRGVQKHLTSAAATAELSDANSLKAFNSNSFTLGTSGNVNGNTRNFVSWNWAGGTTASGNTNGSKAYSYSASTAAGFSVVTYTGNATAGHLIPHGMTKVPRLIHVKSRGDDNGWVTGSIVSASAWNDHGYLYLANVFGTDANQFGATPDATNFRLGTGTGTNGNNGTRVALCFADVKGYQRIGKYQGNGNANGPFVYTGFKPAFVMAKKMAGGAGSWWMRDNKIAPFNLASQVFVANSTGVETNGVATMDILSNGFKLRDTTDATNSSNGTYIYHAMAENPFVTSTGIPACAR